jgi:hypothetical protein
MLPMCNLPKKQQTAPLAIISLHPLIFNFSTDDDSCRFACELYRVNDVEGGYCWFVLNSAKLAGQWLALDLQPVPPT